MLTRNPGKVVPWFKSCVYQLQVRRDVLITQCGAGILTNVRKAAEMSHCLEPKGKIRPNRIHRSHCHTYLMENVLSGSTELRTHVESGGGHTKCSPHSLTGLKHASSAS